jgi:hypothetical protein
MRKVTILLVGLMCFSSVSGFSSVICHGPDGHVAIEPLVHSHCECPETGQKQNKYAGTTIDFSADHEHCKDTVVAPNVLLPILKNVKPSTFKIFIAKLSPKPISVHTFSFLIRFTTQSVELFSFHTPLRSIILLA